MMPGGCANNPGLADQRGEIDMSETTRRWRINPDTLSLDPEDGQHPGTFTAQDWRANEWPQCPVCRETILVDHVNVQSSRDRFPVYTMGKWQCPNDCDPRPVLRGTQS